MSETYDKIGDPGRAETILKFIKYNRPGWEFRFSREEWWLQVVFEDADINTGNIEKQYCRKWKLSPHMTHSELVRTAFKAILAAEEHEAAERFTFCGQRIFDPHVDVYKLAELHEQGDALDVRVNL